MAEKILNTRVLLKYDTYANWTDKNPVLKAGEMAIATVAKADANGHTNLPNIVLKVGDGTTNYNDLKFVSALAADVHDWAKAATKPTYSYTDITGLEQYIRDTANNEIENTDTQYTLVATDADNHKYELRSKGLEDTAWTKVADLDLSGLVSRVATLEGLVGTTKVSEQIATAVNGLHAAEVKAGQGEIIEAVSETAGIVTVTKRALAKEDIPVIEQSQVNGLDTALENAAKAGTDAADQALVDAKKYTDDEIDTAVGALAYTDPNYVAGQFVTKVTEVGGVISVERATVGIANVTGLQDKLDAVDGEIAKKQDALTFTSAPNDSDNRVATEQFVLDSVADLNGAMHFVGAMDAIPTDNSQYAAGDVILVGYDEYVFDGTAWKPLGNESIYQLKADAESQHEALQKSIDDGLAELDEAKQDNVDFKSAYSAENPVMTEDDVDSAIATAIEGLDKAKVEAGQGEIISAIEETNGVVTATKRALVKADIPVIDQSQVDGLADDLAAAAKAGTDAAAQALTDAKGYTDTEIDTAIAALAKADAAVEKHVVTAVAQENGVIAVTRAPLADVAWTGNVNDLVQDEGDVIVFNCGSASVNI